ncbi:Polymerase/histidinol phosphatase-like protein [Kalaharituber pfeilii]|nr:Polymerase/histidinol phosphatase-like protein [Kalaharituber pfeilii]
MSSMYSPGHESDTLLPSYHSHDDESPRIRPTSSPNPMNLHQPTTAASSGISPTLNFLCNGPSTARRHLKNLGHRFNRTICGGEEDDVKSRRYVISTSLSSLLLRVLQLALILTALITTLLIVKYADKPPRKRSELIDYKKLERFNVSALITRTTEAAVWDYEEGLLGYEERKRRLQEKEEREEEAYSVFLEMHTHTTHSDGDLSPEQVVDWALAYGFNAVVVSDHNTLSGGLAAQKYANERYNTPAETSILVIPAIEYTTCRIHMALIGLTKPIPPPSAAWPSDEDLQSVIEQTHAQGGIVVVNHIPWSLGTENGYNVPVIQHHPSKEDLVKWGVDAFEILHARTLDLPTLLFARKHKMPLISSTDLHSPEEVPHGWTVLKDTPLTIPAILKRLRKGETGFVMHPVDTGKVVQYPPDNHDFDKWAPLVSLDFGFLYEERRGMYSFTGEFCHERRFELKWGRAWWMVVWVLLGWGIYEGARWGVVMGYKLWGHLRRGTRERGGIRL